MPPPTHKATYGHLALRFKVCGEIMGPDSLEQGLPTPVKGSKVPGRFLAGLTAGLKL